MVSVARRILSLLPAQIRKVNRYVGLGLSGFALVCTAPCLIAQTKTPTTTALAVQSSGAAVTTVASGAVVTLSATVEAGATPLTTGQVNFCDASAKSCTDIHILATAQLTSAGTATFKLRPGLGSRSYQAAFLETNTYAASKSAASALTITGTVAPVGTAATILQTGEWGSYNVTATVTEAGLTAAPTGTVSFLDANHANAVLATGTLGAATASVAWPTPLSFQAATGTRSTIVADLNGDGIPDIVLNQNPLIICLGKADGTYTQISTSAISEIPIGPTVVGDFNGDGIPDLAVAMGYSPSLAILPGKGDGTFGPAILTTLPNAEDSASQLITADFNGDGIADLAVVNNFDSTLHILLGNGDGTFTAAADPSISIRPSSIATGDFNGDGNVDIAVGESSTDSITILLGSGDGTFTTAGTVQSGTAGNEGGGVQMAAADFNGDGNVDLAVAAGGESGVEESVTLLTGNGDGTFNPSTTSATPTQTAATWFQVADFNQDGAPDVVLADSNGNATVFLNDGSGSFSKGLRVVSGLSVAGSLMVGVGDLNGDGYPDIVVGTYYDARVQLLLTEPTETATASASLALPAGLHQVDANYAGDSSHTASVSTTLPLWGIPPATTTALALTSGGSTVTTVTPGTVVTLMATVMAGTTPVTPGQVNFCDASAPYCTDVHILGTAALTSGGTAAFSFVPGAGSHSYKAVFVQEGYGASSASNVVPLSVGPEPSPVYTDMVTLTDSGQPGDYSLTATVLGIGGSAAATGTVSFVDTSFGNKSLGTAALGSSTAGLGWLIGQTSSVSSSPVAEVTGDFNHDGIPDLAELWLSNTSGGPYSVTIFTGRGDGTFSAGAPISTGASNQTSPTMIAGDFNGDGKTDLAILTLSTNSNTPGSYITTLMGKGDGTFGAPQTMVALKQGGAAGYPTSMVAADFNGDGLLDLAVAGADIGFQGATIFLGNGDGTFTAGATLQPGEDFGLIASGDFNGDGIPDLVVTTYYEDIPTTTIFLGRGDGTFTAKSTSLSLDYSPDSVVVGDFNGDGALDLVFSDSSGIEVALGKGDGTFKKTAASPIAVRSELSSLTVGDFNHDGKVDLAGIDNYYDQIDILIGARNGVFTPTITSPNVSTQFLGPFALAIADFNGDGVPDLAMLTSHVDTAAILLTEPIETATATLANVAPVGVGTHNVDASYVGDSHYPAHVSATVALTSGLAPLTIAPAEGTYSSAQTITITESIPGATIYYYASGIVNTNGYVPYTGPITLNEGGTESIEAYATESGYQQSTYSGISYTMNFPVAPTPTFSLAAGTYAAAQSLTISDTVAGATIYYTTDGTVPSIYSTTYTGKITVSGPEVVSAAAVAPGYSLSPTASAEYLISSSPTRMIYTVAGTEAEAGFGGDGGPATRALLNSPTKAILDSKGNLYIADSRNNVIRKVAAGTGIITTIAGTGAPGYSGDQGPATSATLDGPWALAFDNSGNLYIVDSYNSVVRRIAAQSGIITTVAGNGTPGESGDNGPATQAQMSNPDGLAVDSAGNLYISDLGGGRIRKVAAVTGTITTYAGGGTSLQYPSIGDGGPATSAFLGGPQGLALDSNGNLYISDSFDCLIRKVDASTGVISTVAGTYEGETVGGYSGDGGPATSAQLNFPSDVALDASGNLYIADTENYRIRGVNATTGIITTLAGNVIYCLGVIGDGAPAADAGLCDPMGVSLDSAGNLYVAETYGRVREVTAPGNPPTAMTATPTFSVQGATYASPQTITLTDTTPGAEIYITFDGSTPSTEGPGYGGPIYVNGSITLKAVAVAPGYTPSALATASYTITAPPPSVVSTIAGNGSYQPGAAGLPALETSLPQPTDVAVDAAGDAYIADGSDAVVWKVSASTGIATIAAGTLHSFGDSGDGGPATAAQLKVPSDVILDAAGNLYISDTTSNRVRVVAAATGVIAAYAGSASATALGDGGLAVSAKLTSPAGMAFDSAGNLYIADRNDFRVRMVNASTGIITTVAGGGSSPGPAHGDGGPATSAFLANPSAIAIDAAGNVYIADQPLASVRKVTAATGIISTIAGNEDEGSSGDGLPATQAEIYPAGLAVDASGDLYISSFSTVRELAAGSSSLSTIAGSGYSGFNGDGGSATLANFCSPGGLSFDASGNLYLADECDHRVRKVTFTSAAAAPTFNVAAGKYAVAQSVTVSDATPNATLYCTTDGTAPTSSSPLCSSPITVSRSETIKAFAAAGGFTNSPVAMAAYAIGKLSPTVTVTPSAVAITTAQPLSVMVAVSGGSGNPTPTGSVVLSSGSYTSSAGTLSGGSATIAVPAGSLTTGSDTLAVAYTPDTASSADYNASTGSATVTVSVPKIEPTVTVTPSATTLTTAQPLSVSVAVAGGTGNPTPTGSVVLTSGSYSSSSATLAGGSATISIAAGSLAVGSDALSVAYTPDAAGSSSYDAAAGSASITVTQAIGTAMATVSVTPAATSITDEQSEMVAVAVTGATGQPTPTGSVTLTAPGFSGQQTLNSGAASFTIPAGALSSGSNTLTAAYSGDSNFAVSSGTAAVTVSPVVSSASSTSPVSPGGTVTSTVTFNAGSAYSGTLNLTCALTSSPSGAQSLPTCSMTPTSLTLAAGANGTATLNVSTTASSSSAMLTPAGSGLRWIGGGGAALACVLLLGIPARRRRSLSMLAAILIALAGTSLMGCGGGGGSHTKPPPVTPATTAGNYTFSVTAIDAANSSVTAKTTVTVVVQ
ncbi:MAG TPA: FG-GAP-like repeat-containing protein [Acidobacteriaceae bacterium]|jgi:sugar lactone lactonase YvrE|nr:FG-GAP-like repeat-containing protein [Acidobacteriaceae bacterium]